MESQQRLRAAVESPSQIQDFTGNESAVDKYLMETEFNFFETSVRTTQLIDDTVKIEVLTNQRLVIDNCDRIVFFDKLVLDPDYDYDWMLNERLTEKGFVLKIAFPKISPHDIKQNDPANAMRRGQIIVELAAGETLVTYIRVREKEQIDPWQ